MLTIKLNDEKDYIEFRVNKGGNVVEITDIFVGSRRRNGVGRQLIKTLAAQLNTFSYHLYAITRRDNYEAIGFYNACGFAQIAFIPNFYMDTNDHMKADAVMFGRRFDGKNSGR